MIWVFAVIAVALVTIIIELLMVYQKRSHDLRLRQEPIRSRIREHIRGMRDATEKIRGLASQRVEDLDYEVKYLRRQSETISGVLSKAHEEMVSDADREMATVEEAALVPESEEEEEVESAEDTLREALKQATRKRDEIDGHIISLRRDLEIVRRTMERIDARVTRRSGKKNGGRDQGRPSTCPSLSSW